MRISPLASTVVATAALALTLGTALPASAATTGDTVATFTLTGGEIAITVPAAVTLAGGETGGQLDVGGAMGAVEVTDERSELDASWVADVITTAFTVTGGGGTANETVPAADVDYWSGAITASTGADQDFTPGQAEATDAEAIDSTTVAFTSDSSGDNSATWNPTLVVQTGALDVAGTYSATVTHSVT